MFTYNVTFVVSSEREFEMLDYIRKVFIPKVIDETYKTNKPELKKVVEVAGEKNSSEHGVSLALSVTFPKEEMAIMWCDEKLTPALEDLSQKFGEQAFSFVTLLEKLPL